jgi:hypothetical protein
MNLTLSLSYSLYRSRAVCVSRAVRPRSSRDRVTLWLVPALSHHLHSDPSEFVWCTLAVV